MLHVEKPDSITEPIYELRITLYLITLNCNRHFAANFPTVFISIWSFSPFSRAFTN